MLAYYSVAADREFWSEHWGGHTVEELLAIARTSPLTDLIVAALPRTGVVLEAGCGLGQYVLLLRERGWAAIGVDWSRDALASARRVSPAPLAAMGLTRAGPARRRGGQLCLARRGGARPGRTRRHPGRGAPGARARRHAGDFRARTSTAFAGSAPAGFADRTTRSRRPAASSTSTPSRGPSCSARSLVTASHRWPCIPTIPRASSARCVVARGAPGARLVSVPLPPPGKEPFRAEQEAARPAPRPERASPRPASRPDRARGAAGALYRAGAALARSHAARRRPPGVTNYSLDG